MANIVRVRLLAHELSLSGQIPINCVCLAKTMFKCLIVFLLYFRILTGVADIVLEVLGHELSWRPDAYKLGPRDHKTIAPAIYTNMRAFNCRPRLLSYFHPGPIVLAIFHDFLLSVV